VRLIDVLWIENTTGAVAAAFEVEHSTSIYSGIVRLLDLALGGGSSATRELFLVAPDDREAEVAAQMRRPAFAHLADLSVYYLPYSEIERNRDAMGRFGAGLKAVRAVARRIN
jgi:type II restriction enzyme